MSEILPFPAKAPEQQTIRFYIVENDGVDSVMLDGFTDEVEARVFLKMLEHDYFEKV